VARFALERRIVDVHFQNADQDACGKLENSRERGGKFMMYDPSQSYQTLGACSAGTSPFGSPYAGPLASTINPSAIHPLAAIAGYGINPQQFQGAGIYGQQGQSPFTAGLNPLATGLQHPLLHHLLQHHLAQAALQNPLLGAIGGYGINPQQLQGAGMFGQPFGGGLANPLLQHPLAQLALQNPLLAAGVQNPMLNPMLAQQGWPQQQIGYPLAPQSLIGQGGQYGGGQAFGQIHPLAQLALRSLGAPSPSPWGGGF
jgi:hypothetical protein